MNWPTQQVATRTRNIINFLQAPSKQSIRAENVIGPSFIFIETARDLAPRARAAAKIVPNEIYSRRLHICMVATVVDIVYIVFRAFASSCVWWFPCLYGFYVCLRYGFLYRFHYSRLFCIPPAQWVVQKGRQTRAAHPKMGISGGPTGSALFWGKHFRL